MRHKNRRVGDRGSGTPVAAAWLRPIATALFVGVVFATVAYGSYRFALTSPRLGLRQLTFSGLSRIPEQELLKLTSLGFGQNLFSLDLKTVEAAVRAHPWVKSARVQRHLPHGLSVEVEERAPVAIALLGDLYLVDESGTPFKRLSPQDALDLPLLTGLSRDEYMAERERGASRLTRAIALAEGYQRSPLARTLRLSEVRVEKDGASLVLGEGLEVRVGEGKLEEAIARLEQVREELSKRQLTAAVVHLDNRARPGFVTVQLSKRFEQ